MTIAKLTTTTHRTRLTSRPIPLLHAAQNNPVELMDFAAGFLTKLAEAHRCRLQDHGGAFAWLDLADHPSD